MSIRADLLSGVGSPLGAQPRWNRNGLPYEIASEYAIACVIGDPTFRASVRVRSLSPELAKGLEFDVVVLVDPESFGDGIEAAVDRYVAMTRATRQLVILVSP